MSRYLKELLQYFVDGTPLTNEQYETLINEGFITFSKKSSHLELFLTNVGKSELKILI